MNNKELQWFNIIKNDRDLIEDSQIFNLDRPFENEQLNDLLYYFRKNINSGNFKRLFNALKDAYLSLSTHYPENDLKGHIQASEGLKKHVKDIEEELIGRYQKRTVQNKCEEYINCSNMDVKPQEVIDDIKSMVDKLEDSVTEGESISKEEAVDLIFDKWTKLNSNDYSDFIQTGIESLDKIIIGLETGKHMIIGARPSIGKTALGLTLMANMCRAGNQVAFVSVETMKQGLIERLAYIMTGVSGNTFTSGQGVDPSDFNKVGEALKEICQNNNYIVEASSNRSIRNVARIIRKMKRDNPELKVVITDYMQKIEATDKKNNTAGQISEVSGVLTDLGKKLGVRMITLAQLNRDSEKDGKETPPSLHNFDGSSAVEKDADIAVLIHRSRKGSYQASEEGSTTESLFKDHRGDVQTPDRLHTAFIVAKNRDGRTGLAKARYNSPCTRFEDFEMYDKDSYDSF